MEIDNKMLNRVGCALTLTGLVGAAMSTGGIRDVAAVFAGIGMVMIIVFR